MLNMFEVTVSRTESPKSLYSSAAKHLFKSLTHKIDVQSSLASQLQNFQVSFPLEILFHLV